MVDLCVCCGAIIPEGRQVCREREEAVKRVKNPCKRAAGDVPADEQRDLPVCVGVIAPWLLS